MKRPTITTFAGAQRTRVRHVGDGITHRLLPDVVRGLLPIAVLLAVLALLVGAVTLLPAHPLTLVALWTGVMGLLIALPFATILAVGTVVTTFEH